MRRQSKLSRTTERVPLFFLNFASKRAEKGGAYANFTLIQSSGI